jgi:hypothetical protein
MTKIEDERTIVGIDPTHRGLAFVFFEQGRLLDWGTWRDDENELALLDRVLDGCAADVLVLEDPTAPGCLRRPRVAQLLRNLEHHALRRGRTVIKVAREDVRQDWKAQGVKSKHAVATAIAERFPDLAMILPRPRKVYRSEDPRIQIFDAASLVLFACSSAK